MKYIKTTLLAIVVIAVLIIINQFNSNKTEEVGVVNLKTNSFVESINQQIELIKQSNKKAFSKELYEQTIFTINDYKKNNKISEQWAQNLRQQTEFIYHDKFIQEANYIFSKSDWPLNEISYINLELNRLHKSKLIENKKELNKLKAVLVEYNSDLAFIASSKQYSRSNSVNDLSDAFDVDNIKSIIQKALSLSKTTSAVKNNRVLLSQLSNIKKIMYDKHIKFLNNKVELIKTTSINSYYSLSDYNNRARNPMYDEINKFEIIASELYNVNSDVWYNIINELRNVIAIDYQSAKKNLR